MALSENAKRIGGLPAFPAQPTEISDQGYKYEAHKGMTYRQWLIGEVLSGLSARTTVRSECNLGLQLNQERAFAAVEQVDALLETLATEDPCE